MAFNKSKALEEAARLVSQRKLSQAIRQYLTLAEHDPEDLSLLNTIGDLCVRDGNTAEALRQFHKLAEAYARDGFTLKAIAIYKKITKLDAKSIDPVLKLAELYSAQGLTHESRQQYAQALAFCQSHSLQEKALQILKKLVAQEPENPACRIRLAEHYEASGRTAEALGEYLEAAELAHRHRNPSLFESAIAKARGIDPANARRLLLELKAATASGDLDRARRLFSSSPALSSRRDARLIFFDAVLGGNALDEASRIAAGLYRSDPEDFAPASRFCTRCIECGKPEVALQWLAGIADQASARNAQAFTAELLRVVSAGAGVASSAALIDELAERLPEAALRVEVLSAAAATLESAGDWPSAAEIYRKLLELEPQQSKWHMLLDGALARCQTASPAPPAASEPQQPAESAGAPDQVEPAPLAAEPPAPIADQRAAVQIDFDDEWKAFADVRSPVESSPRSVEPAPPPTKAAPPRTAGLGEEKDLVEFYLNSGFAAEARSALEAIEKKYPDHPEVIELRERLDSAAKSAEPPPEPAPPGPAMEPTARLPESDAAVLMPELEERREGEVLVSQQEALPVPEPLPEPVLFSGEAAAEPTPEIAASDPAPAAAPADSLLEGLAGDFRSILEEPEIYMRPVAAAPENLHGTSDAPPGLSFEDLLSELESGADRDHEQESPIEHYNLGVAFHEMGLLDEAIAEFQKIARDTAEGKFPPRFLEACSLLGMCFMEKRMPQIAARWYRRALQAPETDPEATLALTYDLARAYESSGDDKAALEKFSEVYSLNIDYRDVAEKVRKLQRRPPV